MIGLELAKYLRDAGAEIGSTPSLSQILAEIYERGWEWELVKNHYITAITVYFRTKDGITSAGHEYGDTPEDAAAQILLWILERGGKVAENI